MKIKDKIIFLLLVISISSLLIDIPLFSQSTTTLNSKDMVVDIEWGNRAEIIDHPIYGVIVMSIDRWKNWVFRCVMIIMIYLSIIVVILSMPKNAELNLIVGYILSGAAFVISFWESLSGWMLLRLNSYQYGWGFIFISLPMYFVSYIVLMKVKKYDISYAEIKEEIRKAREIEKNKNELNQIPEVSGEYGEWEDEDFIILK